MIDYLQSFEDKLKRVAHPYLHISQLVPWLFNISTIFSTRFTALTWLSSVRSKKLFAAYLAIFEIYCS